MKIEPSDYNYSIHSHAGIPKHTIKNLLNAMSMRAIPGFFFFFFL